nr:MAG TPA: hypothetical protein [Caudoviricetes sp.]
MNEITAKDAYMIAMNHLNTMSTDLKLVFDKISEKASHGFTYLYISERMDKQLYNSVCSMKKVEYLKNLGYHVKNDIFLKLLKLVGIKNDQFKRN